MILPVWDGLGLDCSRLSGCECAEVRAAGRVVLWWGWVGPLGGLQELGGSEEGMAGYGLVEE